MKGEQTMKKQTNRRYRSIFNTNGTVTYWSVYEHRWCYNVQPNTVPVREMAAMNVNDRNLLIAVIGDEIVG